MQSGIFSRLIGRPAEVKALPVAVRYPPGVLRWELAKGALGGGTGLGILLAFQPAALLSWPLAGITTLFALYAVQQVRRGRVRFEVTERGAVQVRNGVRLEVPWSDLRKVRLNFYGYGRKATQGTLVLHLWGSRGRIKLDSAADHFPTLLFHAARVARERELALEPTTLSNLEQLGL